VVKDRLTVSLRNTLGEDFTIEVIYHTIKQMKPLAAPFSDSIPALFYQKKTGTLRNGVSTMILQVSDREANTLI
jgi:hypothetical protein